MFGREGRENKKSPSGMMDSILFYLV